MANKGKAKDQAQEGKTMPGRVLETEEAQGHLDRPTEGTEPPPQPLHRQPPQGYWERRTEGGL